MTHFSPLTRRRLLMSIPLIGAMGIGFSFWKMLTDMSAGTFNSHDINTPILNRPVPYFTLPGVIPQQGFSSTELKHLRSRLSEFTACQKRLECDGRGRQLCRAGVGA